MNADTKQKKSTRTSRKAPQKNTVNGLIKNGKPSPKKRGRKPGSKSKTTVKRAAKTRSMIPTKVKDQMTGNSNSDTSSSTQTSTEQGIEQSFTSFFYSDEKFITQFEDTDITNDIKNVYPQFKSKTSDDPTEKKIIIQILENIELMDYLLKTYNMTIFEFFKYLYRQDSSLFKTLFIQRIQRAINGKPYTTKLKFR